MKTVEEIREASAVVADARDKVMEALAHLDAEEQAEHGKNSSAVLSAVLDTLSWVTEGNTNFDQFIEKLGKINRVVEEMEARQKEQVQ